MSEPPAAALDAPLDPPGPLRALLEIYDEGFTCDTWGGVETALWHLAEGLREHGVEAEFYRSTEGADLGALAERVVRERVDAVFPLVESPLFAGGAAGASRADGAATGEDRPEVRELRRRVVRIWHDVSRLSPGLATPPPCPVHTPGAAGPSGGVCTAAGVFPDGPAREVFLRDLPWTRCFGSRTYIPWAVDHLPPADLRDPFGPVLLQLGKTSVDQARVCLERLTGAGLPVRVVFATWSKEGRAARELVAPYAASGAVEVLDSYDIRTEWKRVYAGARLFVLPSVFHETFNFAAAEALQLGLPVATLGDCGALADFASLRAETVAELMDAVVARGESVRPARRPWTGWREVAHRYATLIAAPRRAPALGV
ncbi:glycosyltransferase [Streptomyces chrestomyceticus]|uniref:glycosyltransferase n=1 Tax=Streptomyces chrestomyceticus TaxID=68185 RepID=UPI0037B2C5F8